MQGHYHYYYYYFSYHMGRLTFAAAEEILTPCEMYGQLDPMRSDNGRTAAGRLEIAHLMSRVLKIPHAMLPHCLSAGHKPCLAAQSRHSMPTSPWAAKVHRAPRHQNRHRHALSVSANAESPVEPAQLMQGMRESITEALQPAKLDIQDINGGYLAQAAHLHPSYACFSQI